MKHKKIFHRIIETFVKEKYPKDSVKPHWGEHALLIVRCLSGWLLEFNGVPIMFRDAKNQVHLNNISGDVGFSEVVGIAVELCAENEVSIEATSDIDKLVRV